jgi:hypothetical protein
MFMNSITILRIQKQIILAVYVVTKYNNVSSNIKSTIWDSSNVMCKLTIINSELKKRRPHLLLLFQQYFQNMEQQYQQIFIIIIC